MKKSKKTFVIIFVLLFANIGFLQTSSSRNRINNGTSINAADFEHMLKQHDFMNIEDVDQVPLLIHRRRRYRFDNDKSPGWEVFISELELRINTTDFGDLRFPQGFGGTFFLSFIIDKHGRLVCTVVRGTSNQDLNDKVKSIVESFRFIPAKFQGKNVGVGPWVFPLRFFH